MTASPGEPRSVLGRRRLSGLAAALTALALTACGGSSSQSTAIDQTSPSPHGQIQVQTVDYKGLDGVPAKALLSIPRAATPRGCLIWQNGLGTTKEQSQPIWSGAARLGLATFAGDLAVHSNGRRDTGVAAVEHAVDTPAGLRNVVTGTAADLEQAINYLENRPECHHNIAYAGISLGAMIGSLVTSQDKRVRAVVLMSLPPSWRGLALVTNLILPGIAHDPAKFKPAVAQLAPLDPDRWIGQISPRPLLLMIGRHDPLIPPADAQTIERAARNPKTVINYDGGHNPLGGAAGTPNAQAISDFLLKHVVEPSFPGG